MTNGFLIAGGASGSGKTTVTMGILGALKAKGVEVVPFKAGPDYIDPSFHRRVLKRSAYNLPPYMLDAPTLKALFNKRKTQTGLNVVEGVMGYFDGHHVESIYGSSAYLADVLDLPVLMIINGGGMALTAAAILKGLVAFHTPSKIAGVIFNNVQTAHHYQLLKAAVEQHTGVKCYGFLPTRESLTIGSRHLGLFQAAEIQRFEALQLELVALVNQHIDVDALIRDFSLQNAPENIDDSAIQRYDVSATFRLGIAKDAAFSFYYDENLETLEEIGIECIPFSPLNDKCLPDCDALYIGGGYPEVYAEALSQNVHMLNDLLEKLSAGMPVYAECGGLMYLSRSIKTLEGATYAMAGFFDANSVMTERLQHFGHVEAQITSGDKRVRYKGHEFHRSQFIPNSDIAACIEVQKKEAYWVCGYTQRNVIATYVHNHFYSNLEFLDFLLSHWQKKWKRQ